MELSPRQKRRAVIRWLWIPLCAIVVWYGMLGLGLGLHSFALRFCPKDQILSGFCSASWFPTVEHAIIIGCAGLTGLAEVVVAAIVAPMQRVRAAAVVFAIGVAVALGMVVEAKAYAEFAAAVLGGLIGIFIASRLKQSIEL